MRRKPTSKHINAAAATWETCPEIVVNRYIALMQLYKLNMEGK
jgi:hypothetical protein